MIHDDGTSKVKVVPPDGWDTLPIQPTAGYWWRIVRRLGIVVLAAMGTLVILAISSITVARPADWLLWAVLALLLAPASAAIVVCIIAARPYNAERRLGYTTWPSARELKSGGVEGTK